MVLKKKVNKSKSSKESKPKSEGLPKENKLFQNLLKTTQQYILGKSYQPSTFKELKEKLSIIPQNLSVFRDVLRSLIKEGTLVLSKMLYSIKKHQENTVKGTLIVHPRGFGFLQVDNSFGMTEDVFIPKHLTHNAVDGDSVEVLINTDVVSEKGPEGKVVNILHRGRTHIAGIIRNVDNSGNAWAYAPLLGPSKDVLVEEDSFPIKQGDRLVMSILEWGTKEKPTRCLATQYIGHITDPTTDIPAAIQEYELKTTFTHQTTEEAKAFGKSVSKSAMKDRLDLRTWETFTIDPETAKDFDDALSLTKDDKGHYHLGVHIADASFYVCQGSHLDAEASKRCNSTYFPGVCIPMLPAELSDNLCSLRANVNRLTVSVLVELDPHANVVNYKIARSVIKSQKRFSYEEAKKVLDGKLRSKHAPTLHLMVELCGLLKKHRYKRGSIEFSLAELMIVVDPKGIPTGTKKVEYDITHQMVEEFMLKANELVAVHLHKQGRDLAYRIHDEPSTENIREFVLIAKAFGFDLPSEPDAESFQKLFEQAADTPYGEYLANSYIRRMRLACYSAENIGHFGLGLEHYTHFTSPIRRYTDIIVHRQLFEEPASNQEIAALAQKCSEQERVSAKAEQSVLMLKKLRWLDIIHNENPNKQYEAIVTRIKPFGFHFEVLEVMLEGFVHVSELENDYYIFEESKMCLRGRHQGTTFNTADRILVMVKDVDLIAMEGRWHFVASDSGSGSKKRTKIAGSKSKSRPHKEKKQRKEKKKQRKKR